MNLKQDLGNELVEKLFTLSNELIYSFSNELIIGFGAVLFVFFMLLFAFAMLGSRKKVAFAILCLALTEIIIAPLGVYYYVNKTYKSTSYKDLHFQQFVFSDMAIIKAKLVNNSQKALKNCVVKAKAYKEPSSFIGRIVGLMSPMSKSSVKINKEIFHKMSADFEIYLKGIRYKDEVELSLKTICN